MTGGLIAAAVLPSSTKHLGPGPASEGFGAASPVHHSASSHPLGSEAACLTDGCWWVGTAWEAGEKRRARRGRCGHQPHRPSWRHHGWPARWNHDPPYGRRLRHGLHGGRPWWRLVRSCAQRAGRLPPPRNALLPLRPPWFSSREDGPLTLGPLLPCLIDAA